ncbi:MAG TPA: hypothetical protein VN714_27610 [Trebonia sp.]|nr:hypothetical protein [Trebonia sp.]
MSWSLFVLPLHEVLRDGGLAWAGSADFARGVPDHVPGPQSPPRVLDVLGAFRAVGCHGTAWFEVSDLDAASWLPECPDPMSCEETGGRHLGEVSLHVAGQAADKRPLRTGTTVEGLSFRKPSGAAVLHAVCALTAAAGPLLVYDPAGNQVFVVWPTERAEELTGEWPW